ncbi:S-adenosyl-L-methionine-dependent methyltransferase [Mycena galericulata]|nr:S-adenosyl-L-methionine-dependent methyltransferase [Mycena galericulata]
MSVHSVAKSGFGSENELYDRARPSYQASALSHIRNAVKVPPPINVVEIGAGTGIFTRALLAHPEWASSIKELRAFEPSEGMRDIFSKTVSDERVSIAQGIFQQTSVEDGWADLVVIAQAFHWSPDYARACEEFGRLLKPGGILALIWNMEDRDAAEWVARVRDCIERYENGTPQYRLGLWRQAFDTSAYQAAFEPPQEHSSPVALPATVEIVIDRACSKSYMVVLPNEEKAKVREELTNILTSDAEKVWIDESEGIFEYPYKTNFVIAQKKM